MRVHLSLIALLLAACSGPNDGTGGGGPVPTGGSDAALATDAAPAASPLPAAVAVSVEDETPLYDFDYAYPAQAAAIPALKAWLDADIEDVRRSLIAEAREGRAAAKKAGFDFNPYGHSTRWAVVTDLPGWLSLSAERWSFTGGAHGNPWTEALLWDKGADRRRAAVDLFASKQALSAAVRAPFCDALDRERAKRRGEAVDRTSGDMFDECIDPADSTVILGSADRRYFTRIGILVDPYEAGPYAEGTYEITLPVTLAVLKAVKPEYRPLFALGR